LLLTNVLYLALVGIPLQDCLSTVLDGCLGIL